MFKIEFVKEDKMNPIHIKEGIWVPITQKVLSEKQEKQL